MFEYGVFSGPFFHVWWTEYRLAKYGKIQARKTSVFGHFSGSDYALLTFKILRNTQQNNITIESILHNAISFFVGAVCTDTELILSYDFNLKSLPLWKSLKLWNVVVILWCWTLIRLGFLKVVFSGEVSLNPLNVLRQSNPILI